MRASRNAALLASCVVALAACTGDVMSGGRAVELLEPAEGETLTGTVDVVVRIAEPGLLGRVELHVDGTSYATWSSPRSRLEHALDTTAIEDGMHVLSVMDTETSPARELFVRGIVVDNHGPMVEILEPGDSVFVDDGTFAFAVRVTDSSSVEQVRMRAGSMTVVDSPGYGRDSWVVDIDPALILGADMIGDIPLVAEAFDSTGARTEVTRTVNVRRRELWFATEDPTSVAPVIVGDDLVVVTDDGLAVYGGESGTVRCRVPGVGASTSPIAVPAGDAVVWATIERIRIVETADCTVRWDQAQPAADFVAALVASGTKIYASTFAGSLMSFMPDGTGVTTVALADALPTPPTTLEIGRGLAVAPNGTVWIGAALGAGRGAVFQVSSTGMVRALEMPSPVDYGIAATNDGAFIGGIDGTFYKVGTTMMRAWREEPLLSEGHPIECTPIVLDEDTIVTCDGQGRVLALSAEDGRVVWQYDASAGRVPFRLLGAGGMSRGGAGDGLLAVGDRLGMLHVLDVSGNLRWRIQLTETPAAIPGRPAMDGSHLYAVTEHGLIAALAL